MIAWDWLASFLKGGLVCFECSFEWLPMASYLVLVSQTFYNYCQQGAVSPPIIPMFLFLLAHD